MRVRTRKLTKGSLFKLIFVSTAIPFFPFMILCGIASAFGANTIQVNGEYVTGPMGLLAAVVMYPLFVVLFSCIIWLFGAFGLWIYSKCKTLELTLVDGELLDPGDAQPNIRQVSSEAAPSAPPDEPSM